MNTALRQQVVVAIAEQMDVSAEILKDDTTFESLGVDSLEFLDLLLAIGTAAGKDVPQERMPECVTVGDVVRILGEC